MANLKQIQQQIEQAWENRNLLRQTDIQHVIREVIELLDKGNIRIAEPTDSGWKINEWIKKYDRRDLMNTRIMIENEDDISRIKSLQKEIEQLKKVIVKKDLEMLVNDSYLEVIAEKHGYKNVPELKKNLNIKPL